ncbi:MAG: cation diffusion facilitator family transporter [Hyphomicrobiaceae bacterium]|nr:cation diffusion facilitator family transporter [Hyphomicrobiaceae bacterium]
MTTTADQHNSIAITARLSIAVAILVTALKAAACLFTDSVALYSDALEGGVNVASAIVVLLAVEYARRPPDDEHPYGHEKAEHLATGFEGGLILIAALLIFAQAARALVERPVVSGIGMGAAINSVATMINAGWGWYLVSRGRAWGSAALAADGLHVLTDVWTSAGVLGGLALVWVTGAWWFDPVMAILVACYILWAGFVLLRGSLSGLLDEAASPQIREQIERAIKAHGDGAIQAHHIRTRRSGRLTFIEFHLVVPGGMSVEAAHMICDRIERAVEAEVAGAEVLIHVEPAHEAHDHGALTI